MIPVEFPSWVQPALYALLALLAVNAVVSVWSLIGRSVFNQKLDEILAKVKLMALTRRIEDERYYE